MAVYSLSSKAATDLAGIYEYTILNFGLTQAREYLTGLHERFETLAGNPMQGRSASELSPDLRRFVYQSHVVFYVPKDKGIRIVRVLHQSMDMKRHIWKSGAEDLDEQTDRPAEIKRRKRSKVRKGSHDGQ